MRMKDEQCLAEDDKPEITSFARTSKAKGVEHREDDDIAEVENDVERLHAEARRTADRIVANWRNAEAVSNLEFLALGGYHRVWLVTYSTVRRFGLIHPFP